MPKALRMKMGEGMLAFPHPLKIELKDVSRQKAQARNPSVLLSPAKMKVSHVVGDADGKSPRVNSFVGGATEAGPKFVFVVAAYPEFAPDAILGASAGIPEGICVMIAVDGTAGIGALEIDAAKPQQEFAVRMEIMVAAPLVDNPARAGILAQQRVSTRIVPGEVAALRFKAQSVQYVRHMG